MKEENVTEESITGGAEEVEDTTRQKHFWSFEATKVFLQIMETYIDDLNHPNPKVRRQVFDNLSTELTSQGHFFTPYEVNNKWKSLVRSYRSNKDKVARGGGSTYHFYSEMHKLMNSKQVSDKCIALELNESLPIDNEEQGQDLNQGKQPRSAWREAAKERRHKERMAIEQAKIDAQEKMLALLKEKTNLIRRLVNK